MRLRRNFARGTLGAAITDVATTATSIGFATLPQVVGGSGVVIPITIDPDGASPEIVHITAHDTASQTVTIVRGRETADGGNAAAAHAIDTPWRHAPTANDLNVIAVNTDGDAGGTIYVGTVDPNTLYTLVTGDVWLDTGV